MRSTRILALTLVTMMSTLLIGCPINDDDPDVEQERVDAATTPDRIALHLRSHQVASRASMGWVEDTPIFARTIFPILTVPEEDSGQDFESFLTFLDQYVFVDEHLEGETPTELVYLLDGERVCQGLASEISSRPMGPGFDMPGEFFGDLTQLSSIGDFSAPDESVIEEPELDDEPDTTVSRECVLTMEAAQVRLHVTSPFPDQLNIAVRLGPDGHNPINFSLASDISATIVDLEGVGESLDYLAAPMNNEQDGEFETNAGFNPVAEAEDTSMMMKGTVTWVFEVEELDQTRSTVSIVDPIEIETPFLSLAADATDQLFERVADGGAEVMETTLDWGRIEFGFPVLNDIPEEPDGRLVIDGFTMRSLLAADRGDELRVADLSIAEPIALTVGDATIFSVEFGTAGGQPMDMTLGVNGDIELVASPSFEIQMDFQLGEHAPPMDFTQWMADDSWTIRLDGDENPTIINRSTGVIEVVEGTLSLTSQQTDIVLEVQSGQCLTSTDRPQEPIHGFEEFDDDLGEPDDSTPFHPFALFDIGPC